MTTLVVVVRVVAAVAVGAATAAAPMVVAVAVVQQLVAEGWIMPQTPRVHTMTNQKETVTQSKQEDPILHVRTSLRSPYHCTHFLPIEECLHMA